MKHVMMVLALLGGTFVGSAALAQEQQPQQGQNNANRGERGGDRGDRGNRGDQGRGGGGGREQMLDRLKEQLKATDDEWQVLEPSIEKIATAQRNTRGFGGGRGGDRGGDQPQTELQKALTDLRTALTEGSADDATIQQKLAAYRAAREKADAELEAARKELRGVITPRQEAVLVMYGILQ